MRRPTRKITAYDDAIRQSGLSIYDPIEVGDPKLWIPARELQIILDDALTGLSLEGLPLRTRSKFVKVAVCRALGYPVPDRFRRSKPRFPGQLFDTYVQKSNNLQIWNEEIAATRRYVIIQVSEDDAIARIKVVSGEFLARLETTGTLTQKYQARIIFGNCQEELVSAEDTNRLRPIVVEDPRFSSDVSPIDYPSQGQIYSIRGIFNRLRNLVGMAFPDTGRDQERNRGAHLHNLVCTQLGYSSYRDDGRFPDVRHQLLEVKLQTSPTIDLGLVSPDSTEFLDVPALEGCRVRHCDVRYALFCGSTDGQRVSLTHLFVTTGEQFFARFPRFKGRVLNRKLQIPLPPDFFAV